MAEFRADAAQLYLLRAVAESTADAIFLHDRDGLVLYANPQAERLFGWTRTELLGRRLHQLIHHSRPDGTPYPEAECPLSRLLATGETVSAHCDVFFRRNGSPIEVECSNAPVLGADGRLGATVLTICNVTERNRTEAALRRNERRLRELVGTLDLAPILVRDPDGPIRFWSHGCERLYGFTSEEALGKDVHALLHTRFPIPLARINEALANTGEWSGDLVHQCKDGAEIIVATRKVLQRDAEGRPVSLTESLADVTPLRDARAALERLNGELEDRVRTEVAAREEAQTRAAHAERMQALGRLAGGIAHDFNNVLQAVTGAASLIERRPTDEPSVRRYARLILDAADRGAATARRMLAFARQGGLEATQVEPGALLRSLRDILAHTLSSAIEVRIELEPGLPPLLADKRQLETTLVNLATNARDAMPEGGTITLSAASEEVTDAQSARGRHSAGLLPGRYVRLSVTDTGLGMEPGILAHVAEPFFTTKDIGKGTGLGLPMVKGFAEQSGGGFGLTSTLGRGTTVTVWMPVAAARTRHAAREEATAAERAPLRILLVDDEPIVRETLAAQLEGMGHAVVATPSANAALAELDSAGPPDALVTDLTMPGMSGLSLIRRAQERFPGLPAILITGLPGETPAAPVEPGAGGRVATLRKPVIAARLASTLQAVLGR